MNWVDQIKAAIRTRVEKSGIVCSGYHHALDVEEACEGIVQQSQPSLAQEERDCLRAAALLHDIGFTDQAKDSWSLDQNEHVKKSVEIAKSVLASIDYFATNGALLERTLSLINRHEDTSQRYPTVTRAGRPILPCRWNECAHQDDPLAVLCEADSLVHTAPKNLEKSVAEWLRLGIPRVLSTGAGIATWRWMESVVGNLRLIAKRALVDARSEQGMTTALNHHLYIEQEVRRQCNLSNVLYEPEVFRATHMQLPTTIGTRGHPAVEIVRFHSWDSLSQILRSIPLHGDKKIKPYQNSLISSRVIPIEDISPMARYVLEDKLDEVVELHEALMEWYCFGLWDIPGLLEFRYKSDAVQRVAPPVVERYTETKLCDHPLKNGLVDGLHRALEANRRGVESMRVIVITGTPFPLVPMPVGWRDVAVFPRGSSPETDSEKRTYRFDSPAEFPTGMYYTEEDSASSFRYFFFRELESIGSKGRRKVET